MAAGAAKRGDYATAVRLSREAVELGLRRMSFNVPLEVFALGRTLYLSRRPAEAVEWLSLADAATADDFRWKGAILIELARSLGSLGRYKEAESVLERASTLYDESPVWKGTGLDYERWTLRTPAYRREVAGLKAYVAWSTGAYEDARSVFEGVAAIPGARSREQKLIDLNNLAAVSIELGDLTRADQYIEQATVQAGGKPWRGQEYFFNTRGMLRLAQGRLNEARADFKEVLTLRGPDFLSLVCLAEVALNEDSVDEAGGYIAGIPTDPNDSHSRKRFAQVLARLADLDAAAGRIEQADAHRRRSDSLLQSPTHPTLQINDSLMTSVRAALNGLQFGRPSTGASLAFGTYLSVWLLLGTAIVLLNNPPGPLLLLEAVLLVAILGGGIGLRDRLFRPQRAVGAAHAR